MIHYKLGNKSACGIFLDKNLYSFNIEDVNCEKCLNEVRAKKFKKGDMILVKMSEHHRWEQRRFVLFHRGKYYCEQLYDSSLVGWKFSRGEKE